MRRRDCWQAQAGGLVLRGRISRAGLGGLLVVVEEGMGRMGLRGIRGRRYDGYSDRPVICDCCARLSTLIPPDCCCW